MSNIIDRYGEKLHDGDKVLIRRSHGMLDKGDVCVIADFEFSGGRSSALCRITKKNEDGEFESMSEWMDVQNIMKI